MKEFGREVKVNTVVLLGILSTYGGFFFCFFLMLEINPETVPERAKMCVFLCMLKGFY